MIRSLSIEEVDDATALAGELFQRSFGHPIPDFPRHFVALGRAADGEPFVAAYVHYSAWEETAWLCGGVCADRGAYTRAAPADAAEWKRAGGLGEIILRETFARLTDRPAIFSYCGDARQWQHDLNAGFEPAGPPLLLVRWNHPGSRLQRAGLVERIAALGPF